MVDPQSSVFWQTALKSGLVNAQKLEACWQAVPADKRTGDSADRRLARQAVNAGHLTLWQAQQLLTGRTAGLRIDRYLLQDLLGQGGMGRVYLALDTKLNRQVALKILSRERMSNPRAMARFRREAKVGAQLQHENLIRIYDEGEYLGINYLVMEYIKGRTVAQMIADQGRLPYPLAANLTRQVALGLAHLYRKELLHRDINPMNILVDRDGTAKLTDLGLAIDLDDMDDVVTRDGATVGTFDYISPEQARHSRQIDTRSDMYSLGCTIYHMIAGRVPFPAPSLPEKLFAHQSKEPEPLSRLVEGVPEELDQVVRRMMSKKVEDRFQDPSALAEALEPFAVGAGPKAVPAAARAVAVGADAGSEPPTVVEHQASSASPSPSVPSDAELPAPDANGSPVAYLGPTVSVPAGGADLFKLDLGPSPRLSDSRSADGDPGPSGPRPLGPWTGLGALAVLVLAGMVGVYMFGSAKPPTAVPGSGGGRKPGSAAGAAKPGVPKADITVEYNDDGTVIDAATLPEAINLAQGKPAEVVLRNKEPLHLEIDKPHRLSRGGLTIRAEAGTKPVIGLAFKKSATWLLASANTNLKLSGLTFQVVRLDQKPGNPAVMVESGGNVELDRCAFQADRGGQGIRVLKAEGRETRVSGCWFEGFDGPLAQGLFPGSSVEIRQSIFTRSPEGDSASGWPLAVKGLDAKRQGGRTVKFDHVTAQGAGLLRAEGFSANLPLKVEVENSVVSTHALLMWKGAYPAGLSWSGEENIYEVSGSAWVVQPPNGFNSVKDSPSNLESWAQDPVEEEDARVMDVKFAVESPAENHKPGDFALKDVDAPKPGADPSLVGPGAGTEEKGN